MGWNNAVITNSGLSLIAQAVSGGTLDVTSAGLGGGTVETSALMAQTKLTTPLTVPAVISAKGILENGLTVRVQIRNTGVTAAQRMKQVGLFAKLSDNDPVLFAIMQDDTGEEIPPAAEYPDFMIEFTAAVAVSNTDNIVVTISSSAVITRGALDEELKKYTKADQFNELSSTVSELSDSKADKASVEEALNGKADTGHTHTVSNISDFPDSLPANGGNADTVGNKPISQILAVKGWYELDMNELKEQGSYIVVNAANCPPTPAWGTALVFIGGTGSVVQLYICSVETEAERMTAYIRHYTGDFWTPWVNIADGGNAATLESHPASDFALKTEIPTTLPANGGRADAANAAYHQVEHFLESGTDVLAYVTSDICPTPFNTIVRIINSPTCPTNYGYSASDNDFFYHIFKLDNSLATVKAFDIRGNVEFINSCLNGTWTGWVRCNDGGNADTANLAGALSSTPTNVCLRNLSSGTADVTTTNCPSGAWYGQHS